MRRIAFPIALAALAVVCLAPAPAAAVDFSLFGSYMDTDDVKDAPGVGARVAFFDRIQLQLSGTWYDNFDYVVFDQEIDQRVSEKIDILPIDVGGAYYFKPEEQGFYAGAGLTWFLLDANRFSLDDEVGYYIQLGYQFRGFFVEAMYRDAEGTVKTPQDDIEWVDNTKVKITGYSIQAGWRF